MHSRFCISLSLFCCLLAGCSIEPNELKTVERIMDAHPDSALKVLQHLKPENYRSDPDRALYGLLMFQALEKNNKDTQPVSLIDFSMNYYERKKDNHHLANCYFFKGRMFKHAQRFDIAAEYYIKALDCIQNKTEYELLGKIYFDMGDIYAFQKDYPESYKKYRLALRYLTKSKNRTETRNVIISIGRRFSIYKKSKIAQRYFRSAIAKTSDSLLIGLAYQEIGIDFSRNRKLDSAKYYICKSLQYPYRNNCYSIRTYCMADLLFDLDQYDEAGKYAIIALKYPTNFNIQKECYRILVNVEYNRKNLKQMGLYMTLYQDYVDSVRRIESQTKIKVFENLHNTAIEAKETKKSMILIVSLLLIVLLLSAFIVVYLYKRNKLKRELLDTFTIQLNSKQKFVSAGIMKKIEEAKALQADKRKNSSVNEREKIDKELYNNVLHLNDSTLFNQEMNHAFNNIIETLKSDYHAVNQKEITWCCLHLLDIPHADRMLMLESTSDSLYKLKQRLAQKLNLKTTKDLDSYLQEISKIKN